MSFNLPKIIHNDLTAQDQERSVDNKTKSAPNSDHLPQVIDTQLPQNPHVLKQQKLYDYIQDLINKTANAPISSNIILDDEQINILRQLNVFCINQVINNQETLKNPLKIVYKSNDEFKIALIALCLTRVLTNQRSKKIYTKEFIEQNIHVMSEPSGAKYIDFGVIEEKEIDKAINAETAFDWMVYRDYAGRGINALMQAKEVYSPLKGLHLGGNEIFEFARFQRKYHELQKCKEQNNRESAQTMFRNTLVQQAAIEIAKQQMQSGLNPIELVNMLFDPKDYNQAIRQMLHPDDNSVSEATYSASSQHNSSADLPAIIHNNVKKTD